MYYLVSINYFPNSDQNVKLKLKIYYLKYIVLYEINKYSRKRKLIGFADLDLM